MTESEKMVRRFQRGEPGGFDALYAEYGARIYRFALRLSGNPSDAEDLTQEVFLAAFQGREGFGGRSTVATWLYRIALYRHQRIRGNHADVPLAGSPAEHIASTSSGADPATSSLDRLILQTALAALPENLRNAFLLVKVEGLTCQEAATVLNIPTGTVKYHVHQAVARLQKHLTDGERDPATDPAKPRKEAVYAV